MADSELQFAGISAGQLYSNLLSQGVSHVDSGLLVSSWIFENLGQTLRTFAYREGFPADDAAPLAAFQQKFHHRHWRDGEDVVQAEPSATDDGFNRRFDNIEADLASLGQLLAGELAKVAAMRLSLFNRFEELRAEINRINSAILKLQQGEDQGPTKPPFGGLVDTGNFVGVTTFMNKKVNVWKTAAGEMMMLPYLNPITEATLVGKYAEGAGHLSALVTDEPDIRARFPGAVKRSELVDAFGDKRLANGLTVREIVDVLPADASYTSIDSLVEDVAERNAGVIRSTDGAAAALGVTFGTRSDEAFSDIKVDELTTIAPDVKNALMSNNVRTVADLAALEPQAFATMMTNAGVSANAGVGAKLRGVAKTLTNIRR